MREVIRLEPVSLGWDSEEKGETQVESPWGAPVLGLTQVRRTHLSGWAATGTNRRAVGSPDSPCEELAVARQGRGQKEVCPRGGQFLMTAKAQAPSLS